MSKKTKITIFFIFLLFVFTPCLAYAEEGYKIKYSAGGTNVYATNLSLNPSITGLNIASGSDILYIFNAAAKLEIPFSEQGSWIANIKGEETFAYVNQSLNNHAFLLNGGVQYAFSKDIYISALAKYKFAYFFNRGNLSYKSNDFGAELMGFYSIKPINLVGIINYDTVSGWDLVPGSSYDSMVFTLLAGGSIWEGGNLYVGPTITAISTSPTGITSGIISFSQQFGALSTNINYIYQSKGASTGHLFVVGANYNF